ncbi:MAG: PKD domain-containing protein [Thermoplasmata archaeon]|nr:PKD domain-containing protein [Thermoplasmata archaeon]
MGLVVAIALMSTLASSFAGPTFRSVSQAPAAGMHPLVLGPPSSLSSPTGAPAPARAAALPPNLAWRVASPYPVAPHHFPAVPPTWWAVPPSGQGTIPAFWFTQGTWDAHDGYVLFYGGDTGSVFLNQTWTYRAGAWTYIPTSGNPGYLDGPSMAYDPGSGSVVMYGGLTSYSPVTGPNATFLYSGGTWTTQPLVPNPGARLAASMAYDPDLGGVVLFGGRSAGAGTPVLNDLWLFKNGAWLHLPSANPPSARWMGNLAYDPLRHDLILYGGDDINYNPSSDTWTYANGSWTRHVDPAQTIVALGGAPLDYDPDLGVLVLAGGLNASGLPARGTWQFNGTGWTSLTASGAPDGHYDAVGVYDPLDHEFVLAGGNLSKAHTDVLSPPIQAIPIATPTRGDVGQWIPFSATAIGGATPHGFLWSWGDGALPNSSASATHRYAAPGIYTVTLAVSGPLGNSATWSGQINVTPALIPALTAHLPALDVGVSEAFEGTGSGGWSPYQFAWNFGDGSSASGPTIGHTYATKASVTVVLTVTDAAGGASSASLRLLVNATPIAHIFPVPPVDAGVKFQISGWTAAGTPPYTYAWAAEDGTNGTGSLATLTLPGAGAHTLVLTVTDALGVHASATASLSVASPPSVSISGPGTLPSGGNGTWTAQLMGGSGPFRIAWTAPDGSPTTGSKLVHGVGGAGSAHISVTVTDAAGAKASGTYTVNVTAPTQTPLGGSVGGTPLWLLAIGAAVGVAIAATAAIVIRRRRIPVTPESEHARADDESRP